MDSGLIYKEEERPLVNMKKQANLQKTTCRYEILFR